MNYSNGTRTPEARRDHGGNAARPGSGPAPDNRIRQSAPQGQYPPRRTTGAPVQGGQGQCAVRPPERRDGRYDSRGEMAAAPGGGAPTAVSDRPRRISAPPSPGRMNAGAARPGQAREMPRKAPISRPAPQIKRPGGSQPPEARSGGRHIIIALVILGIAVFLIGLGIKSCVAGKTAGTPDTADRAAVPAQMSAPAGASSADTAPDTEKPDEKIVDNSGRTVLAPYRDSSSASFDPAIDSEYGIMVERGTGRIVARRDPDAKVYPASLTKVMSLIVAVENCGSLDDTLTFTNAIIDPVFRQGASMAGFDNGETVTLRDMLYGMILPSGADAAEGICICVAGDDEHFVALMNEKAKELGLKKTHFANASGLHDPEQYSTCTELAIILDYAIQDPTCRTVLSTYKYTTAPTEQHPEGIELTSDLQARMEGGESGVARILGGKTGYVTESKYCLATFARADADGREYVIVTCMGSGRWKPIFDHINICKKYIGGLSIE